MIQEFKEGDVYNWEYSELKKNKLIKHGLWSSMSDNYHCKDRQFVVRMYSGKLRLVDTYWRTECYFSELDEIDDFVLTYKVNLNDFDELKDVYEFRRAEEKYKDDDLLELYCQKGYSNRYFRKKSATISVSHQIAFIENKINKAKESIQYEERQIKHFNSDIEKLLEKK